MTEPRTSGLSVPRVEFVTFIWFSTASGPKAAASAKVYQFPIKPVEPLYSSSSRLSASVT